MKHLLAIVTILGIFVFSAVAPLPWVEGVPLCFFKALLGWDCPGCGVTRGFVSLFHGHFLQALQFNALVPVLLLFFILYLIKNALEWAGRGPITWGSAQGQKWVSRLFVVLLLGQWVAKTGVHAYQLFKGG